MAWFGKNANQAPIPVPSSLTPDYTIDTVRNHLESIGMARLQVRGAEMKVLLSKIAWNGERYLLTRSPNGQPSGAQIVELCKQLETVQRVVAQYQQIEHDAEVIPNAQDLLAQGVQAVKGFAARLSNTAVRPGGSADLTGYVVDTQILSM